MWADVPAHNTVLITDTNTQVSVLFFIAKQRKFLYVSDSVIDAVP